MVCQTLLVEVGALGCPYPSLVLFCAIILLDSDDVKVVPNLVKHDPGDLLELESSGSDEEGPGS